MHLTLSSINLDDLLVVKAVKGGCLNLSLSITKYKRKAFVLIHPAYRV